MLISSDNIKYNLELKELANMLFAGKVPIHLIEDEIQRLEKEQNKSEKNDNSQKYYEQVETKDLQTYIKKLHTDIISLKKIEDTIHINLIQDSKIVCELSQKIDYKEKSVYKKLLYQAIKQNYDNITGKWGTLTGIRPVKLVNDLKKEGNTANQIQDILRQKYMLSQEKIQLIQGISTLQEEISSILVDDISIYISIPFCPSRCNYCSFFSIDIQTGKKYIKDYLKNLDMEIEHTLKLPYFKNKNITSIYVGGGTPSSLDEDELKIFFDIVKRHFDIDNIREFTFEAGRVDTLSKSKLEIIKNNGVSRISINPQTMNDETLVKIGRNHTAKQVVDIYNMAVKQGFDNINMDLILGLANEDIKDMDISIDKILELEPASITIHCLAIKRASYISEQKLKTRPMQISQYMQDIVDKLDKKGYMPYYLYRQKNMLENGENIGFCKKGKYNLYNVAMMDEMQSIIAFGASASSKIIKKDTGLIRRIPNYKDVILYNNNIFEMVKRKEQI